MQALPDFSYLLNAIADCLMPPLLLCVFVAVGMLIADGAVALWCWLWRKR